MPYPYYQPYQAYGQQLYQNIQPSQQVQTNGIITVRSKEEAISYPIAPGNSLTFKHETEPYIYTKTLGFSQLDRPVFEVFRLEREDIAQETVIEQPISPQTVYCTVEEASAMQKEINTLRDELKFLKDYVEDDREEGVKDA